LSQLQVQHHEFTLNILKIVAIFGHILSYKAAACVRGRVLNMLNNAELCAIRLERATLDVKSHPRWRRSRQKSTYRAHRAVIFAVAQPSCNKLLVTLYGRYHKVVLEEHRSKKVGRIIVCKMLCIAALDRI